MEQELMFEEFMGEMMRRLLLFHRNAKRKEGDKYNDKRTFSQWLEKWLESEGYLCDATIWRR